MAQDKQLSRLEAKLDALLKKGGMDPADFGPSGGKTPTKPRQLTQAQQEAIDNAPKYIEPKPTGTAQPNSPAQPATPPDGGTDPNAGANDFPWPEYDKMNVEQVLAHAKTVDAETRARALAYERKHKNRNGVIEPLVNWNS